MQPSNVYDDSALSWHISSRKHYESLIVDVLLRDLFGELHVKTITAFISYTVYLMHSVIIRMQQLKAYIRKTSAAPCVAYCRALAMR